MYTHTSSPSRRILSKETFGRAIHSFSRVEWYVFLALVGVVCISALLLVNKVNNAFLVSVPLKGGHIEEGIIGTPRFVNPVLAVTDAEKDLTAVIYSGLMKKTSEGTLVPDLANSYEVSADGLTYTFAIKDDAVFHNGMQVESKDVVYTIQKIQNTVIKSPKKVNWEGVEARAIDTKHVSFTLKQPYSGFLENTTLGILPQEVWEDIPDDEWNFSELNINPIGSGPYQVAQVNKKKSSGIPESFELKAFQNYVGTLPYIPSLTFSFFANENEIVEALNSGHIDQASALSPSQVAFLKDKNIHIEEASLSRVFGLFFNQSNAPIFTDKTVVKALDMAIDKQAIVDEILGGYGEAIDGPIPPHMIEENPVALPHGDKVAALELLTKAGWSKDESGILVKKSKTVIKPATTGKNAKPAETRESSARLSFSISTGDAPELRSAAEMIQKDLQALGAEVEVKVFETGNLNQNVIRPRNYDALFFGEVIGRESDFFAFWHSSQRNDPGLNVALYANTKVDTLLENALTEEDRNARIEAYKAFEAEIQKDMPAIFVYSPHFIYIVDKQLSGFTFDRITVPSERFLSINDWYVDTDRVWNIFAPKE